MQKYLKPNLVSFLLTRLNFGPKLISFCISNIIWTFIFKIQPSTDFTNYQFAFFLFSLSKYLLAREQILQSSFSLQIIICAIICNFSSSYKFVEFMCLLIFFFATFYLSFRLDLKDKITFYINLYRNTKRPGIKSCIHLSKT